MHLCDPKTLFRQYGQFMINLGFILFSILKQGKNRRRYIFCFPLLLIKSSLMAFWLEGNEHSDRGETSCC